MQIIQTKKDRAAFLLKLDKRAGSIDPSIIKTTEGILGAVKKRGDSALRSYTKRFDGHESIRLSPSRIKKLAGRADKGIRLGQLIRPLERVGIYVPGGKAAYPSTVLMNVVPAQVAGVPEIAVCVPTPGGEADPNVMAALELLGIKEAYSIGGAQAIAALAYGTRTIKKVDKITGPGNVFVSTAKRMVFGAVDIDMIAGPSEILIIADKTADPAFVAADLLSQAEHDEVASSVLVTDSPELTEAVNTELTRQLKGLDRKKIARTSLRKYGAAIIVRDMEEAAEVSNLIAPEHLEVMTKSPRKLLPKLQNAGAVFLGPWTPEAMGDYLAGPNHTLPTGGTSRWASPLGVYDFLKRTSVLEFTDEGFNSLADTVEHIARKEGLDAHANSVRIRKKS